MVKVQVDMSKKANKNLRLYMIRKDLYIKSKAINQLLEEINVGWNPGKSK